MSSVFTSLSVLSAIAATVLAYIFIMPEKKRASLNGIFKMLHDFLNFKTLFLEVILKGAYIFFTALSVFLSFFGFLGALFNDPERSFIYLVTMVAAPVVIRLVYEIVMMFVILVKNVTDINKKMGGNPQPKRCPHCGAVANPGEIFCNQCGQKI